MIKNKQSLKNKPIDENLRFLINLLNNTKNEIKKVNQYLQGLNHNKKIIQEIIDKIK